MFTRFSDSEDNIAHEISRFEGGSLGIIEKEDEVEIVRFLEEPGQWETLLTLDNKDQIFAAKSALERILLDFEEKED